MPYCPLGLALRYVVGSGRTFMIQSMNISQEAPVVSRFGRPLFHGLTLTNWHMVERCI